MDSGALWPVIKLAVMKAVLCILDDAAVCLRPLHSEKTGGRVLSHSSWLLYIVGNSDDISSPLSCYMLFDEGR